MPVFWPLGVGITTDVSTTWVSYAEAAQRAHCGTHTLQAAVRDGRIIQRPRTGPKPCLDERTVTDFATWLDEQRRAAHEAATRPPSGPHRPPPVAGDVWLDTPTVALLLGVTEQWVARLAASDRLPAVRVSRQWWFRRSHVETVAAARAFRAKG